MHVAVSIGPHQFQLQACKKLSFFHHLYSDVPNAGQGLKRLDFKQDWDVDLREYMKKLDAKKPVILCGDLNVAHLEIGKWLYHSSISIVLIELPAVLNVLYAAVL